MENYSSEEYRIRYAFIYIPLNKYGIKTGHLLKNEFVNLLRQCKNNPEAIQFLADMLE